MLEFVEKALETRRIRVFHLGRVSQLRLSQIIREQIDLQLAKIVFAYASHRAAFEVHFGENKIQMRIIRLYLSIESRIDRVKVWHHVHRLIITVKKVSVRVLVE